MRSIILTVVVLGVLLGGFVLFMSFQESPESTGAKSTPKRPTPATNPATQSAIAPPPSTQETESVLGAGEDVWVQQFDRETGLLTSEFRAARYDPPQDGVVHVTRPEARFYTRDGQVLTIWARDGEVIMPEQTRKSDRMDSIQSAPPSRGTLNDVLIGVLDTPESTEPSLTCRVPVIAFDNDALRLYTVQTEIEGRIVPADRVPITVRGDEYDFDGQGLSMRWNQRDQRLEHLEIARGGRLVVKKPAAFGKLPISSTAPTREGPFDIQLVQADATEAKRMSAEEAEIRRQKRLAAARRAAALAATQAVREPVAYKATFADDVKILEGADGSQHQIGSADRMIATFTFERPKAEPPATQPATKPAPAPRPTTRPTTRRAAETPKPEQVPIMVTWTGKLTIVPGKYEESGLRAFDDRAVQFEGSPVKLDRDGSTIEAAVVSAASKGDRFSAKGSDRLGPVVLRNAEGTTLRAPAIDIVGDAAVIKGKSSAEMMVADEKGELQKLLASWADTATINFRDSSTGRSIESAEFVGNVDVAHPQLALKSAKLKLAFGESAKPNEPSLRVIDAAGDVRATIATSGEKQTIKAENLRVTASPDANGKLAFNGFTASGGVSLASAKQSLNADKIDATFTTTEKEKVRIDDLTAEGSVVFKGEDETHALAEVLSIVTKDGVEQITLRGRDATVADRQSKLVGSMIKISTDGSSASVVGPGTLTGLARAGEGKTPQPITVTWADSFSYDGPKNSATVSGAVVVASDGTDGSRQRAAGKRMTISLSDAAKNTTGGIGRKQVNSITLSDDVEVSSVLTAEKDPNRLLRRIHLFAPGVTVTTGKEGVLGPVTIPSGGRMLYEDRRAATDATTQPDENAIRGAIAIEWKKSMTHDPAAGQVVLDGDVVVVYQQPGQDPIRMLTQKLIAQIDPEALEESQQLNRVHTEGGTSFITPKIRFDAAEAVYEPGSERVVVRGTERQPVEMFDESGLSSGSYEEIWWNLRENRPERLKNVMGTIRR